MNITKTLCALTLVLAIVSPVHAGQLCTPIVNKANVGCTITNLGTEPRTVGVWVVDYKNTIMGEYQPFSFSLEPGEANGYGLGPSEFGNYRCVFRFSGTSSGLLATARHTFSDIEERVVITAVDCPVTFPPPPEENAVIVDNGTSTPSGGTSYNGTWNPSSGEDSYGTRSVYSIRDSDAKYNFTKVRGGNFSLYMWWTWYSTRCSNVQVDIFDDNALLDTVYVDQADKLQAGKWIYLGKYFFIDTPTVTIHGQGSGCSTCADAVKFEGY